MWKIFKLFFFHKVFSDSRNTPNFVYLTLKDDVFFPGNISSQPFVLDSRPICLKMLNPTTIYNNHVIKY